MQPRNLCSHPPVPPDCHPVFPLCSRPVPPSILRPSLTLGSLHFILCTHTTSSPLLCESFSSCICLLTDRRSNIVIIRQNRPVKINTVIVLGYCVCLASEHVTHENSQLVHGFDSSHHFLSLFAVIFVAFCTR